MQVLASDIREVVQSLMDAKAWLDDAPSGFARDMAASNVDDALSVLGGYMEGRR